MKGYWQRPEATAEAIPDGWFRTGDMGRVDADGYFTIVDRKKDLIIRGGYNVYPREVEEALYKHPAVAEAAVIGLPESELGEEVGAAVALKPGANVTADEVREHVKRQVAAYKYPRRVWIVDALPKTARAARRPGDHAALGTRPFIPDASAARLAVALLRPAPRSPPRHSSPSAPMSKCSPRTNSARPSPAGRPRPPLSTPETPQGRENRGRQ
jgi:AMP-binding enzyme C-terminal domain/AMP-binding enzyme